MYVSTHSGKKFYPLIPHVDTVCIDDIAHHLAMQCRFNGATDEFYSVAQHAVLVSELVPSHLAFEALHHDSAEAYVSDVITPIKMMFPDYREWEKEVQRMVEAALGITYVTPIGVALIKQADLSALATEKRDLMTRSTEDWPMLQGIVPSRRKIVPWSPKEAKTRFLARHNELLALRQECAA